MHAFTTRHILILVLLSMTALAPSRRADAQVVTIDAEALAALLQAGRPSFAVGLLLGSNYQSNPRLVKPDDATARTDGVGAIFSGKMTSPRTRIGVYGYGNVSRVDPLAELNRTAYGGRFELVHRLTPRVTANTAIGVRSASAVDLAYAASVSGVAGGGTAPGTGGGSGGGGGGSGTTVGGGTPSGGPGGGPLSVPTANVRLDDIAASLRIRTSPRSNLELNALGTQSTFATSRELGGKSWSVGAIETHRFAPVFTTELRALATGTSSPSPLQPASTAITAEGGGTLQASDLQFRLTGGAYRVMVVGTSPVIGPVANATFTLGGARGFVSFFADRRAVPSFGLERILTNNSYGIGSTKNFGRSAVFTFTAQRVQSSAPSGTLVQFASTNADATLRQQLGGFVVLTTSAFMQQREERATVRDIGASVSMAFLVR